MIGRTVGSIKCSVMIMISRSMSTTSSSNSENLFLIEWALRRATLRCESCFGMLFLIVQEFIGAVLRSGELFLSNW